VVRRFWIFLILAAVYAAAAKLGLKLAFDHPSASAVWPPTGIALAACLLLGYAVWPSILAGAFLANIATAGSAATSLGIAAGNTLEAVVGCYLVTRFANGQAAFDRPQDIFKFAGLAGLVSTAVSATGGVTSLAVGGYADWAQYPSIWLTWWLGDAAGALVVAPFLLLWSQAPRIRQSWAYWSELFLALALIGVVSAGVFGGRFPALHSLEFLPIPILVWVAFRLGRRAAATAMVLVSAIAIWGTLAGVGPFITATPGWALLRLQAYMSVIAIMALVVAAAVAERGRVEQERLQEAAARHRAYEALEKSEELHRAIAELASDFALIARVEPDGTLVPEAATEGFGAVTGYTLDELRERGWGVLLHPEDMPLMAAVWRRVLSGERIAEENRIILKTGAVRWIRFHLQPFRDEKEGPVVRILTAAQDITDRRAALEAVRAQQELIRQLSTPVLRVRERLLILPVIGEIDPARADQISDQLLGSIRSNRAKVVVIDLTGVAAMDATVAERILRTAQACRVLGASVIVSGVSRELGNVLVHTGLDLSQLVTKGDLQGGIEEAEQLLRHDGRPPATRNSGARAMSWQPTGNPDR